MNVMTGVLKFVCTSAPFRRLGRIGLAGSFLPPNTLMLFKKLSQRYHWRYRVSLRKRILTRLSQYPNALFSTPIFPFGSVYVANGPKLINEIRTGPDDVFSPAGAVEKVDPNRVA